MDYLNYKVNPSQWRVFATSSHLLAVLEHFRKHRKFQIEFQNVPQA